MKFLKFIFGSKNQNTNESPSQNPYVKGAEGRAEWNNRFMNMKKMIHYWQLAFFGTLIAMIVLSFVVVRIASQSKVQPFVVETNHGMPYAIKPMESISSKDEQLINFAVNQFIINARTIISDAAAEKNILNKLYAYSANNTINFLHDFFEKNNPFELAAQYSVSVNIINSLPLSNDTWQITWDETKHNASGVVLETSRFEANITYKFGDVNPKFMTENPFGIYITQVSWAKSQS